MPILTRRLREFLESPESFSPGYRRVLRHMLKSRISEAMKELEYIGEKLPELFDEIGLDRLACGRSGVRIPPGPPIFSIIASRGSPTHSQSDIAPLAQGVGKCSNGVEGATFTASHCYVPQLLSQP